MMLHLFVIINKLIRREWLAGILLNNHLNLLLVLILLEQILLLELTLLHYLALRLGFPNASRVVLDTFD